MVFFEKTGNYVENSDYFSDYKGYKNLDRRKKKFLIWIIASQHHKISEKNEAVTTEFKTKILR